jgi:predicted ATP-grasp superfamily ATP-dependent carboligase
MAHPKVLLTDCWTRKTVSAVRSLGKEGVEVHAVSHTLLAPAIFSKYVKKHYIFPFPEEQPEEFKKKILELIRKEKFDCIMPMDEAASEILLSERNEVEKYTTLPLASAEIYKIANDKWETLQAAKRIGVPIPESFMLKEIGEAEQVIEKLKFPFIIKPRNSSGSRGIKKITNRIEFDKYYPVIKEKYGEPILQEFIPQEGQGMGVGSLAQNGNTLVNFSYKRLREYPVNGGPSTLRESTDDPLLKKYSTSLLKEINWHGIAMVEFKMDVRDNVPKLMEINPRFWGSLQLAQVSGINFPYLLYLQSQKISLPKQSYKTGIRCRWLIPGDIAHFISNPKRFSMKPSFFNFADKNTFYDQYDPKDFKGNLALIICSFLTIFSLRTWKMGVFRK